MTNETLPSNNDAERMILGSIILEPSLIVQALETITYDNFYNPIHKHVFRAMTEVYQAGNELNVIFIAEELKKYVALESIGGLSYLTNLTYGLPNFSDIYNIVGLVKDKSDRRAIINTLNNAVREAITSDSSNEDIIGEVRSNLDANVIVSEVANLFEPISSSVEEIIAIREGTATPNLGISTGWLDVDNIISGCENTDLIVIAARPSMGKTSMAVCMAIHAALNLNKNIMFFSLEMSKKLLAIKSLCMEARCSTTKYKNGTLSDDEWDRILEARSRFQNAILKVDENSTVSPMYVKNKLNRELNYHSIDMIFVDYLQLMRSSRKAESRLLEITSITAELKQLAKEFNIPVVLLSQLNRGPENRTGNRPKTSDLRDSGTIEQDADKVALLFREDYYRDNPALNDNRAEIIISKNRNGPIGDVFLRFDPDTQRFDNLSEDF